MSIALAAHGGAWNIPDDLVETSRRGLTAPLTEGFRALSRGASALTVVELVVRGLEDEPVFNAGTGSHLNREGRLEMDASIMEGTRLRAGAVAAVSGLKHPVSVARRVLEDSPHVLLVAEGAKRFARAHGEEVVRTPSLLVGRELERFRRIRAGRRDLVTKEFSPKARPHGTVGAVARDRRGRVAAATSTGGTQDKAAGRVGDTPIVGAGTYADDRLGAASCTGWGEAILRVVLAKAAVDALAGGSPPDRAARAAVLRLTRVDGFGGLLLVDAKGRLGIAFNTPRMARGFADARGIDVLVGRAERRR
jgi:beta-aspartyl-peptidase (threonine type)